jgi:molybdopterin-binding protein
LQTYIRACLLSDCEADSRPDFLGKAHLFDPNFVHTNRHRIRSVKTAGGHHRIPQSEVDRLLYRTRGKTESERNLVVRRVSGRNQLVGRIDEVRISGLMAEVLISIGDQQITSIITARSAREMNLRSGQAAAALIKSTEVMILRI